MPPGGLEPPLCVAICHRMGEIAKTLLTYTEDVTVRRHPPGGSAEHDTHGPTVTDLASDDFCCEPIKVLTLHTAKLKRLTKPPYRHIEFVSPLRGQDYWHSWESNYKGQKTD